MAHEDMPRREFLRTTFGTMAAAGARRRCLACSTGREGGQRRRPIDPPGRAGPLPRPRTPRSWPWPTASSATARPTARAWRSSDTDRIRAIARRLRQARRGHRRGRPLVQPAGRRSGEAAAEPGDRHRRAGPGRGHRRPLLRGHRRLVQHRRSGSARTRTTSRRSSSTRPSRTPARSSTPSSPSGPKFCYEMMGWALPDSPDSYLRS